MTSHIVCDTELRKQAYEWAERTATEQGLPPKIEDVVVIRRVLFPMGFIDANGKLVKPVK